MKVCKCSKMWLSLALKNGQIYRKVFEAFSNVSIVLFWILRSFFLLVLHFKANLALML